MPRYSASSGDANSPARTIDERMRTHNASGYDAMAESRATHGYRIDRSTVADLTAPRPPAVTSRRPW